MKQCTLWCWLPLWACHCLAYKLDSYRKATASADSLQVNDLKATLREAVREEIKESLKSEILAELRPPQPAPAAMPEMPQPQSGQRLAQLLKTISVNLTSADGHFAAKCSKKKAPPSDANKHSLAQKFQHNLSHHTGKCADDGLPIFDFQVAAVGTTCCPPDRVDCAGCAKFDSGACAICAPGFVKRGRSCVACTDSAEWLDQKGNNCAQTKCNHVKVKGQSSKEACCRCGGGHVSPTSFSYPDKAFVVGEAVKMAPVPRTAARYTLNYDCEFAAYNLTMDGRNGAISFKQGLGRPTEPFQVQCEVTAHQAALVVFTAVAAVTQSWMTYEARVLKFSSSETYNLKTAGETHDLKMSCAPDAPWLSFDSTTSTLSLDASKTARGGVVEEGQAFTGQDGAVCVVTGRSTAWGSSSDEKQGKATFVAVWPRPWQSLSYPSEKVSVSVGEELPLLRPVVPRSPSISGSLKPKNFRLGCNSSVDWVSVAFDRTLNALMINGNPLIQVSESGELTIGAPEGISKIFDSAKMANEFTPPGGAFRQSLTVSCSVWGGFADPALPQVKASLEVEIQDNVCWVPQKIPAIGIEVTSASEAECRNSCRITESCSHFAWTGSKCYRYEFRSGGIKRETLAKVTGCRAAQTCLAVEDKEHWRNSGIYCPLGADVHGQVVYQKKANTTEDAFYLEQYSPAPGRYRGVKLPESCSEKDWLIRQPASADYADAKAGHFELKGGVLKCLPKSSKSVQFHVRECKKPSQLDTPDEAVPTLVADDPGTRNPEDFWLHPCDCAPDQWGTALPVNEESWETIPAGSNNKYMPAPYAIVSGQFVCPSRQLLNQHWETESEAMERVNCEAKCREERGCNYFWHGTQHSASVCRTFRGCDSLVREFGLNGELSVMPRGKSCQVADAALCWQTTLRRSFLARPASALANAAAGKAEAAPVPKKPKEPPSKGMEAWFKSEDAGSVWPSSVGSQVGKALRNAPFRAAAAGFGADRPVTFLEGDEADAFEFGWLPRTFTLCSVTRYTSRQNQKRILQGTETNFLHGHYASHVGVAHYNSKWVTKPTRRKFDLNWLVLCGTNRGKRVFDGSINVATLDRNHNFKEKLVINAGKYSKESSNFAVMEVLTWNRALSSGEMKQVTKYLQWKLKAGAFHETEPMGTSRDLDLYEKKKSLDSSKTYTYTMVNGYTLKLSGWTHERDYAKGVVRTSRGKASAAVSGLAKKAAYRYEVYSASLSGFKCDKNLLSVNGGTWSTMRQQASGRPSGSGIVTSDSKGEIKFKMDKKCLHLHLNAITVAKILPAKSPLPKKPSEPSRHGMISWFKSEDAGSVWKSSVGNHVGVSTKNSVVRASAAGFGADRPVTFIQGGRYDDFSFGKVLPKTWTLCSVTRYTGEAFARILQGKNNNLLHGHWNGRVGVAHYGDKWVTATDRNRFDLSWLVMCGTNKAKSIYDGMSNVATRNRNAFLEDELMVNTGKYDKEDSDFAVMEVITWNRALKGSEMKAAIGYLTWKLQAGTFQESEHMPTDTQASLATDKDSTLKADRMYSRDLRNGYKLELSGWTHTRQFALGYVRNAAGSATAVVSKLKPNTMYRFEVQSFDSGSTTSFLQLSHEEDSDDSSEGRRRRRRRRRRPTEKDDGRRRSKDDSRRRTPSYPCSKNKISVNHGSYATMRQDSTRSPSASGVVVASPRGNIQFEFVRACHHVQLMSISVARMYGPMYGGATSMLALGGSAGDSSTEETDDMYQVQGFPGLHLYEQCDTQLLLGGMGVQHCARPTFRGLRSHKWEHKRRLPDTFQHGQNLFISCWAERFAGLNKAKSSAGANLQCVDGAWHGSASSFKCEACVHVAAAGYTALDDRDKQELYFFNRMQLHVYSELGMEEIGASTYCLEQADTGNAMTVASKAFCRASFLAETTAAADSLDRFFQYLPSAKEEEKPNCLQLDAKKVFLLQKCTQTEVTQLLSPAELPLKMWDLHVLADAARATDVHGAYASLCGAHGAFNNLDFSQLFAGNTHAVKTSCKFAPLISFGKPTDSGITRDKNSGNWADWWHILAEHPIECQTGQAITGMKLDVAKKSYSYECSYIGGLGACFEYFSGQVEVPAFNDKKTSWQPPLSKLVVACGENSVISALHFEFSEGGRWARVRYFCCKAGGSPTVMEPIGYLKRSGTDGKYCPQSRDASGRPVYKSGDGNTLSFDNDAGKWCIGESCIDVNGAATPVHLTSKSFEVVAISNFDGEFAAMGVPKAQKGSKGSGLSALATLTKPKPPKLPKMPELEAFEPEMPTYSSECLNYKDLWTQITETFKDSEGEQVTEDSPIEEDPGTEGKTLQEYHPCEIARHVGGTFGKLGKQDGSNTPENMLYDDWEWCGEGDRERDLLAAGHDFEGTHNEMATAIAKSAAAWACEFVPDIEVAPMGVGVQIGNSDICGDLLDVVDTVTHFTAPFWGDTMHRAKFNMELAQESYDACSPTQVGFPRIFCDLHCTRDAVVRGDRSIIRNLETATRKTNANIKSLAKWSVDSTKMLNEWVASKQDYTDAVNSIYFKEILAKLGDGADSSLLERSADAMLLELKSLAETAGARYGSVAARTTTQDALLQFVQSSDLPDAPNASEAAAFLQRLEDLHAILHRAARSNGKKSDIILKQLAGDINRLQGQVQGQLRIIGVYSSESRAQTAAVQSQLASQISGFERHSMLISLDQVWWRLRNKLDQYEDVARDELAAFQLAFADFQNFEACTVSFSDLILSYTNAMATLQESHRQLRATWREASNLFGELVSIAVDGDAFNTFRRLEGCQSSLALQTIKQAQAAVKGLYFLVFRMRAAGFGKPDQTTISEAAKRLKDSFVRAMQGCEGSPFNSV